MKDQVNKVMGVSFITNIFLALTKIISGFLGSSGALIADGFHSLSDTVTDVSAIIGNVLSKKPADEKHPLGHGKVEYITCSLIGFIVMTVGISIIYESINSDKNIPSTFVMIVCIFTIIAKFFLSRFVLKQGKKLQSNILTASGKESFSDVISSLVVLISASLAQLSDISNIFSYADKVAMIIVGLLILRIAYHIIKENISSLLGEQVTEEEYINKIKEIINNYPEIIKIDSLIILKYGPFYKIDCEVGMNQNMLLKDVHQILEKIEENLKNFDTKIDHIIIHVNPYQLKM